MQSTFANSYLESSFNKESIRNTSVRNTGNDDFMEWLSSFNPSLLSRYPSLSNESRCKLRSLHLLSLQADSSVEEVTKTINRFESEYEALAQKNLIQLQLIGIGEEEELGCESNKFLQESAALIVQGNVGDGTNAGAAAALAVDYLAVANSARQKMGLEKDIRLLQRKIEQLKERLLFFKKESNAISEEVSSQQAMLDSLAVDLNVSQAKSKRAASSVNAELEDLGVSPAICNQAILDLHKTVKNLQKDIHVYKEKFKQYEGLPPSITGSTEMILNGKQQLESVSDELKVKLTSFLKRKH